ncbi:hypothetical protein BC830DRAFT_1169735 [Chytriomyces sp. MP71]|nr:hypothetical protein BC830DRAFT_1169735 [Chytriomyces sp. MP71]
MAQNAEFGEAIFMMGAAHLLSINIQAAFLKWLKDTIIKPVTDVNMIYVMFP